MSYPLKYSEDLLGKWDKRVQIEATLLFFFSASIGSSFLSLHMFWKSESAMLDMIPFIYLTIMFCWWHVCKRICFNTTEDNSAMMWSNAFGFLMWQVLTAAVSFSSWDEWGWNEQANGKKHPVVDNLFRFVNCFLVTCFLVVLMYDYFNELKVRLARIKLWAGFLWMHALFAMIFFADWVSIHRHKTIAAQVLALLGSIIVLCATSSILLVKPSNVSISIDSDNAITAQSRYSWLPSRVSEYSLVALFVGVVVYWWGSCALNCNFYPDTSDMTLMPGYQMLWIMSILIALESLPTMASDIHVLGAHLLLDEEDEEYEQTETGVVT